VYHVVSWFGSSSDPFQPIVIPWNIGAIASIYLLGVWLVSRRRSARTRALTKTGSDDSYGVYLAQLVFITALGWAGWRHLNAYVPWPIVCLFTVVIVFFACVVLTEVLARTPLAKPLTGRSRVPRRARPESPAPAGPGDVAPAQSAMDVHELVGSGRAQTSPSGV
jgi:peptidoglycan/LPS O-acetylase OafA/YrhL